MPRKTAIVIVLMLALVMPSAGAERNLQRPPGTTRYAPMISQLNALLAYDKVHAHRMTLSTLGRSVKGRELWMVTLQAPLNNEGTHPAAGGFPPETGGGRGSDKPTDYTASPPPQGEGNGSGPLLGAERPKRIFYLCRQHGHEPASTEGALAFMSALVKADEGTPQAEALTKATLYIIPMANPDGAEAFLRHNAHNVDLNRDWLRRTQPETRALYAAIRRLHPDLMTDQHELYPDDTRPDFTEAAETGSGAPVGVVAACDDAQAVVQGAMLAEGFPIVNHWVTDKHPARLAHRYASIVAGIPTILFETNRLTQSRRSVAARAAAQEKFMLTILRDQSGDRDALIAEATAWQVAHPRETQLLASRHRLTLRTAPPAAVPNEKGTE